MASAKHHTSIRREHPVISGGRAIAQDELQGIVIDQLQDPHA